LPIARTKQLYLWTAGFNKSVIANFGRLEMLMCVSILPDKGR